MCRVIKDERLLADSFYVHAWNADGEMRLCVFLNGNDARESVLLNGNVNDIITSRERAQQSFRIHTNCFQNAFCVTCHFENNFDVENNFYFQISNICRSYWIRYLKLTQFRSQFKTQISKSSEFEISPFELACTLHESHHTQLTTIVLIVLSVFV